MYSYHNRIRQRINNDEYIGYEKVSGEFSIILHFRTHPYTRPIREHALWRYADLLK